MKRIMPSAAMTIFLGGLMALTPKDDAPASDLPSCRIDATRTDAGYRLSGIVEGVTGAGGSFQFTLDKTDAGGTSTVKQSGAFELQANVVSVGEATLSLASGGQIVAEMILFMGELRFNCGLRVDDQGIHHL